MPTSSLALGMLACTGGASNDTAPFSGEPVLGDYDIIYNFLDRDCYGVADVYFDSVDSTTWELEPTGDGLGFVGLERDTGWHFQCELEGSCFNCIPSEQHRDWAPSYDALQTISLDFAGHWTTSNDIFAELIYTTSCEGSGCSLLAYDTGMLKGFPCVMASWGAHGTLRD